MASMGLLRKSYWRMLLAEQDAERESIAYLTVGELVRDWRHRWRPLVLRQGLPS
jgi:hypothetical protein